MHTVQHTVLRSVAVTKPAAWCILFFSHHVATPTSAILYVSICWGKQASLLTHRVCVDILCNGST